MLYEMLTGTVPFTGPNPFAVMNDRLLKLSTATHVYRTCDHSAVQEIIYRPWSAIPENRYASAREFTTIWSTRTRWESPTVRRPPSWKRKESPPAHRDSDRHLYRHTPAHP